jgi:hypothetical protein
VIAIEPDEARLPVQPSPALPPPAEHDAALVAFQVSEMLAPTVWVAALLDIVTCGVVAPAEVDGTAV